MFTGLYRYRIDAKGRLAVPARFRDGLPAGSVISLGPGSAEEVVLTIYPPEQWQRIAASLPVPLLATQEQRRLSRTLNAASSLCEFDAQGRVTLTQEQRLQAGIAPNSSVAILGNLHVVEIWPEARWNEVYPDHLEKFTATSDKVISVSDSAL